MIPAEYRRQLDLRPGDRITIDDGEIRLYDVSAAVRRAQEALKPYRPKDGRLASEELLRERRASLNSKVNDRKCP